MNTSAATATTHEDNHDGAHDNHDDAHDMVVHVTYEDICKCILFFVHMYAHKLYAITFFY